MKCIKSLVALLLCAIVLLSGLPVLPFSFGTEITASAADVTELKSLVDSIAERSKWSLYYVDTTVLAVAYDNAIEILKAPQSHQDSEVRTVIAQLKSVLNTIQYHTIGLAVDPRDVTVPVGACIQLKVTKEPSNAADAVTWISGNSAIAEVNNSGEVTVKKYSDDPVLISAVSNGISSSCTVHITKSTTECKHQFGPWVDVVPASCGRTGVQERVCQLCGQKESQVSNALLHKYSEEFTIEKEPTCAEEGIMYRHCIYCGALDHAVKIPTLAHKWGNWKTLLPNEPDEATVEVRFCSACGAYELREGQKTNVQPQDEPVPDKEEQSEGNFFQRIIEWFRNLFARLFGR